MAFTGLATLYAGSVQQIQIGGSNGLTTSQTLNVTGTITTTGGSGAGITPYSFNVLQGTVSNSDNSITSGVLCYGANATSATNCTSQGGTVQGTLPYTATNPSGGAYMTSGNGVTFAMINQGVDSDWQTSNFASGTSTINIPIGIFGVTSVDTMLNDNYGVPTGSDISVTFNFDTTATGTNGAGSETFTLVDGEVIRDAFQCTSGSINATSCLSYQSGGSDPLNTTLMYNQAGTSLGAIGATTTPSVYAYNVITGTYTTMAPTGSGGAVPYVNTAGNLYLDAQVFNLGSSFLGDYLTSIKVTDAVTASFQSKADLTAIDVFAAPEPSTIFLFVTGIGLVALVHLRRRPRTADKA